MLIKKTRNNNNNIIHMYDMYGVGDEKCPLIKNIQLQKTDVQLYLYILFYNF